MSARQAFIPRPPSCTPSSESHPQATDMREGDGDRDIFVSGNGKARSIAAFLGQKRGIGTDTASPGAGPTPGTGLGRANTSTNRRSFEGIRRPDMTPMSIIPYPATTEQLNAGAKQSGAGQTPRKTVGPGEFEFPKPMTPLSMPRGLKKGFGIFAGSREDEPTLNGNTHGNSVVFMGPRGEVDVRIGAGTDIGGYMRMFEESGGAGSASEIQSNLERDVATPMSVYALGGHGANTGSEGYDVEGIFARSSRSLDATTEIEADMERNDSQRRFGGLKRGMRCEDMEGNGRYTDEGDQLQGSAKRMRQVQHDPNEYFPISSPHIPPTPGLPISSANVLDPSLVARALFENIEEFVSLEEIEADWKRWRDCTTEEWLKGADELVQEYTDILNMVKDRLTEKVLTYANMIKSVEEKRTEVNHNIEVIHGKGNIVRENISNLGTKK